MREGGWGAGEGGRGAGEGGREGVNVRVYGMSRTCWGS